MTFRERDENVFMLAGSTQASGPIRLVEQIEGGARPVYCTVAFAPRGDRSAEARLTWRAIGAARRADGDMVDLRLEIRRSGEPEDTAAGAARDILDLTFPIDPAAVYDPVFATILAASFRCANPARIAGLEIVAATSAGIEHVHPIAAGPVAHGATGFRFAEAPSALDLTVRLHFAPGFALASPVVIDIGRLFVGLRYDPYRFNPYFELSAHRRPVTPGPAFASIAADFVAAARDLSARHRFATSQSFIWPFEVRREGDPEFSMLCGTINSLYWYGLDPPHHCEIYRTHGFIEPGDVVFDCGAHAGQMAAYFARMVGPAGKVFAFEPFPQNYLQVEAQAALNGLDNLVSMRSGVGETRGTLEVSNAVQMTVDQADHGLEDRLAIAIERIDDHADLRPTAIKLDVEGAEVGAIRGAAEVLRRFRPKIICEFHTTLVGAFSHTVQDFLDALPLDLYEITIREEGAHEQIYTGTPVTWTRPGLISARPK